VTRLIVVVAAAAAALGGAPGGAPPPPRIQGRVIEVRTVEAGPYGMAFDPVRITVSRGDTVRWVQGGRMPHNVAFRVVPPGTTLGDAERSPYLERPGATYELVIDERFAPGKHVYVCTPHEVMGMAGVLYVSE